MTAPSQVQARTVSSAAERCFEIIGDGATHELDPDERYRQWLELEYMLVDVLAMVRAAVGGAARDLAQRGDSQREIAARHLLTPREVQRHVERAPLDV